MELMQLMLILQNTSRINGLPSKVAHMHDVQITRESPNYRLG